MCLPARPLQADRLASPTSALASDNSSRRMICPTRRSRSSSREILLRVLVELRTKLRVGHRILRGAAVVFLDLFERPAILERDPNQALESARAWDACAIFMDEPSVMGTENALMAAALTPGPTTIGNAACEPHVQDLARLLTRMGAQVDGIGSNVMTVHGRDRLGGAEHTISPDHIEVGRLHGAGRGDRGRGAHPRRRTGRPGHGPPPVPPPRAQFPWWSGARDMMVLPGQALRVRSRPRRCDPEDGGRPLACFPG